MERSTGTGQRRSVDSRRRLVARFSGSGLTVAAFCRRESISAASLYRWRALLRGAFDSAVVARTASVAGASPRADFLDLGTLAPRSSRVELRLDLGGGVILQLARG
jgi:transposase-like protein